jgi:hypothetical protein
MDHLEGTLQAGSNAVAIRRTREIGLSARTGVKETANDSARLRKSPPSPNGGGRASMV